MIGKLKKLKDILSDSTGKVGKASLSILPDAIEKRVEKNAGKIVKAALETALPGSVYKIVSVALDDNKKEGSDLNKVLDKKIRAVVRDELRKAVK